MEKTTIEEWNKADAEGIIHIPDELDPLVNKIAFQIRFMTISGKNSTQTICDIAWIAQKFFSEMFGKKVDGGDGSTGLEVALKTAISITDIIDQISIMKDDSGREGCTYGDTDYDSMSAVYGYNLAIDHITETLTSKIK